jgi:peptide deformylase
MNPAASLTYPHQPILVHYPHPALRRRAEPVTVFDDALRQFCHRMFACLEEHMGLGLAAPQVGAGWRLFVTDHARREEGQSDRRIWINPRMENGTGTTSYEEGCLSFPGLYARIERCNRFDLVYQNEWGVAHRLSLDVEAGDFLGIVVQHELDHLDGKLFVDHLTPTQLGLVSKQLREMERVYRKATGRAGAVLRR